MRKTVYTPTTTRTMQQDFKGINLNRRIAENEFAWTSGVDTSQYPALISAKGETLVAEPQGVVTGMIYKDALCYTEYDSNANTGYWVQNEYRINMGLSNSPKQIVSMGAYAVIFPDKKIINTEDLPGYSALLNPDFDLEHTNTISTMSAEHPLYFVLCAQDGTEYTDVATSGTEPAEKTEGTMWMDVSTSPYVLKKYSESSAMWIEIPTVYTKIKFNGIGNGFKVGDGVYFSGLDKTNLNGWQIIQHLPEADSDQSVNSIVIIGIIDANYEQTSGTVTIARTIPDMDFVVEAENRLWGCKYGVVGGEVVNTIYCSKLGDPKNWQVYQGISTDSWFANIGSDGQFTGAITYSAGGQQYPMFFKEDCVHQVYISPTGAHQVVTQTLRGVKKGCARSLAIIDEVLYYVSTGGIVAYNGGTPTTISNNLGDMVISNAVAAAAKGRYCICGSCRYTSNVGELPIATRPGPSAKVALFYDKRLNIWHGIGESEVMTVPGWEYMCAAGDVLYFVPLRLPVNPNHNIYSLGTSGAVHHRFKVYSGKIGFEYPDKKYVSRLNIRYSLDIPYSVIGKAELTIFYSDEGEQVFELPITNGRIKSILIPLKPHRCEHFRWVLESDENGNTDELVLYSVTKILESGSDVK